MSNDLMNFSFGVDDTIPKKQPPKRGASMLPARKRAMKKKASKMMKQKEEIEEEEPVVVQEQPPEPEQKPKTSSSSSSSSSSKSDNEKNEKNVTETKQENVIEENKEENKQQIVIQEEKEEKEKEEQKPKTSTSSHSSKSKSKTSSSSSEQKEMKQNEEIKEENKEITQTIQSIQKQIISENTEENHIEIELETEQKENKETTANNNKRKYAKKKTAKMNRNAKRLSSTPQSPVIPIDDISSSESEDEEARNASGFQTTIMDMGSNSDNHFDITDTTQKPKPLESGNYFYHCVKTDMSKSQFDDLHKKCIELFKDDQLSSEYNHLIRYFDFRYIPKGTFGCETARLLFKSVKYMTLEEYIKEENCKISNICNEHNFVHEIALQIFQGLDKVRDQYKDSNSYIKVLSSHPSMFGVISDPSLENGSVQCDKRIAILKYIPSIFKEEIFFSHKDKIDKSNIQCKRENTKINIVVETLIEKLSLILQNKKDSLDNEKRSIKSEMKSAESQKRSEKINEQVKFLSKFAKEINETITIFRMTEANLLKHIVEEINKRNKEEGINETVNEMTLSQRDRIEIILSYCGAKVKQMKSGIETMKKNQEERKFKFNSDVAESQLMKNSMSLLASNLMGGFGQPVSNENDPLIGDLNFMTQPFGKTKSEKSVPLNQRGRKGKAAGYDHIEEMIKSIRNEISLMDEMDSENDIYDQEVKIRGKITEFCGMMVKRLMNDSRTVKEDQQRLSKHSDNSVNKEKECKKKMEKLEQERNIFKKQKEFLDEMNRKKLKYFSTETTDPNISNQANQTFLSEIREYVEDLITPNYYNQSGEVKPPEELLQNELIQIMSIYHSNVNELLQNNIDMETIGKTSIERSQAYCRERIQNFIHPQVVMNTTCMTGYPWTMFFNQKYKNLYNYDAYIFGCIVYYLSSGEYVFNLPEIEHADSLTSSKLVQTMKTHWQDFAHKYQNRHKASLFSREKVNAFDFIDQPQLTELLKKIFFDQFHWEKLRSLKYINEISLYVRDKNVKQCEESLKNTSNKMSILRMERFGCLCRQNFNGNSRLVKQFMLIDNDPNARLIQNEINMLIHCRHKYILPYESDLTQDIDHVEKKDVINLLPNEMNQTVNNYHYVFFEKDCEMTLHRFFYKYYGNGKKEKMSNDVINQLFENQQRDMYMKTKLKQKGFDTLIPMDEKRKLVMIKEAIPTQQVEYVASVLLTALHFLHNSQKVLHRNINAHNILVDTESVHHEPVIKNVLLCNFGRALKLSKPIINTVPAQEDYYQPPESVMHGEFSVKSDLFSVGVLLFYLKTHYYPFQLKYTLYENEIKKAGTTIKIHPYFDTDLWGTKESDQLKSLIFDLLQYNPKDRPSWVELEKNPYVIKLLKKDSKTNE